MKFYNFWPILEEAVDYHEVILLTYAAIHSGKPVAYTWNGLLAKLNINIWRTELQWAYFIQEKTNLVSCFPTGEPLGFVNPQIFYYQISALEKASYIKLASRISNEQRWNYRREKKPILLPNVYTPKYKIPENWIKITNNKIHMIMEEKYYGSD